GTSLRRAYEKSLKFALVIGLSLSIFLSTFSDAIIVLILGREFAIAGPALKILAWCLVPMFLTSFLEKTLVAGDKQFLTTVGMALALGVNVLLNFLLIPSMGYVGSCVAALVAETIPVCMGIYFVLRCFRFGMSVPDVIKPLLAGLITYGVINMFSHINLFFGLLLEVGVYGAILLGLKTFTREEIWFVKQLFRGPVAAKPAGI
ncbi:MAG: polysaccharide biosynthesis C-terminal domain-containing protein, partial [Desulfobacterales bacterium]